MAISTIVATATILVYKRLMKHIGPLGGSVHCTSGGDALVTDVPLHLWTDAAADDVGADVVLVQFFRTCKDVITLLGKQSPLSTQNLSILTENFSITLEVAHGVPNALNVWQIFVGLLDPVVPFTFTSGLYGSEIALCQAVVACRQSNSTAASSGKPAAAVVAKLTTAFAAELAAENGDYDAYRKRHSVHDVVVATSNGTGGQRCGHDCRMGGASEGCAKAAVDHECGV